MTGFDSSVTALTWFFALSLFAIPFKQDWLLQGLERMPYVAPAQALKSAAFVIGVLLAVHGPADFVRVGLVEVVAASLGAAYFVVAQRVLSVPVTLDVRLSGAWPLIRAGASIGASNIVWPFMTYAPILLVTNLAGSAEAAWLGGVQRIVVALMSFSALYFFNLYPLIARGLSEDRVRWRRLMGSSVRVIAWASIGLALATTLFADTIVTAVFGERFLVAAPVLSLYIWVLPLRLLSGHARWTLLAAERQGVLLIVELACAATLVAFSVALIPRYGAAGAALSAVLGNVVGWLLAHVSAERYVGPLPGFRQVLLPISAAIIGAGVARLVSGAPVLSLGLAMVAYALCMRLIVPDLVADAVRLAYAKKSASGLSRVTDF